jgi:hypothetical protein
MTPKPIERLVYTLIIILALIAIGLVAFAPDFMNSQVIYQGF